MNTEISLNDRVMMITGATGGIGEALALDAAARGAELILAGRRIPRLEALAARIESASDGGSSPVLYPVDLAGAGPGDYEAMATAVATECGRLDAVIHLAADFGGLTPLDHVDPEGWQRSIMVNLHAVFLINRAVHGLLKTSRGRLILTLDDTTRVGGAYWGAYGVAKHALRGLLSITAAEWEADRIGVYGVEPPPTRSRLRAHAYVRERQAPADPEDVVRRYLSLLDFDHAPPTGTILGGPVE